MKNKKGEIANKISLQSIDIARSLCGERDENLRLMEEAFDIRVGARVNPDRKTYRRGKGGAIYIPDTGPP